MKTHEADFSADHIEIGEFVLCQDINWDVAQFTENSIGQYIYDINDTDYPLLSEDETFYIKYDYVPPKLKEYFDYKNFQHIRPMSRKEIIYHSKNKEDLETILNSMKYNL